MFSKGILLEPVSTPGSFVLRGRSRQCSRHRVTFSAAIRKKSLPLCFLYQGWRKNAQGQCTRGLAVSSKKERDKVYGEWKWTIIVSLSTLSSWWFKQVPGCREHRRGNTTLWAVALGRGLTVRHTCWVTHSLDRESTSREWASRTHTWQPPSRGGMESPHFTEVWVREHTHTPSSPEKGSNTFVSPIILPLTSLHCSPRLPNWALLTFKAKTPGEGTVLPVAGWLAVPLASTS